MLTLNEKIELILEGKDPNELAVIPASVSGGVESQASTNFAAGVGEDESQINDLLKVDPKEPTEPPVTIQNPLSVDPLADSDEDDDEDSDDTKKVNEDTLVEMAMDSLNHPTHGKLSWDNENGVHKIKKEGKTVFSGSHEEVASRWKAIKQSLQEGVSIDESVNTDYGSIMEALRLKNKHELGDHQAKVYHDPEWDEYRVKFYSNGQHQKDADYHTDDVDDANSTAQAELKRMRGNSALTEYYALGVVGSKAFKISSPDVYDVDGVRQQNPHLTDQEAAAVVDHTTTDSFVDGDTGESTHNGYSVRTHKNGGYEGSTKFSESADALLASDARLTEEFKIKAKELFEEKLAERVKEVEDRLVAKLAVVLEQVAAEKEEYINTLSEKIDVYLDQVSEQWAVENKAILESNVRLEIAESFVTNVKGIFESLGMEIPEAKKDTFAEMEESVAEMQGNIDQLNTQLKESIDVVNELTREKIINENVKGLTNLDQARMMALVEDVEYTDAESFGKRIASIKSSAFPAKGVLVEDKLQMSNTPIISEDSQVISLTPKMQAYLKALQG